MTGKELHLIAQAHFNERLSGDGLFTNKCHDWLESFTGAQAALLTSSCTAALEMAALLLNLQQGDEIIMPSFTFVSTANAFATKGAVPVFVDIRSDTLNLDETLIEGAITARTKAIVPVHYAGVGCEMDQIKALAAKHGLMVIEDAAQGACGWYRGSALGTIGDLGTYSFHETKNVIAGEGGALLINRGDLIRPAEIIREKGTDRSQFFRGEVDKYTWQALGSSYVPGELMAAFLFAQLEAAEEITARRLAVWNQYHELLEGLEQKGVLRRPVVPENCQHNGHMYYILLAEQYERDKVIEGLRSVGIHAVFHYVPLHDSPAGLRYARVGSELPNTETLPARLIRLPMWVGLESSDVERVVSELAKILRS
jgi:dTDP-4-amino-4,6-dideoxygalactose transaminase